MATRRKAAATPSNDMSLIVLAVGVVGTFVAIWFGLPGVGVLWLALVIAAWSSVAVDPDNQKSIRRHQYAKQLQTSLFFPLGSILRVNQASWVTSVLFGVLGYLIPDPGSRSITASGGHLLNAVFALFISFAIAGARSNVLGSDYPGLPLTKIKESVRSVPLFFIGALVGLGVSTWGTYEVGIKGRQWGYTTVIRPVTPRAGVHPAVVHVGVLFDNPLAFIVTITLLVGWLAFVGGWSRKSLLEWRELSGAREMWANYWLPLKKDPAPLLTSRTVIGDVVTIETFQILPHENVNDYLALEVKYAPMTQAWKVAALSMPEREDQPGTWSATKFAIVQWQSAVDVTSASSELVSWWLRSCMAWTVHTASVYPEPALGRLALISEGGDVAEDLGLPTPQPKGWWQRFKENSPTESTLEAELKKQSAPAPSDEPGDQLWATVWAFPANCASWYMRENMMDTLIEVAGCDTVIDDGRDTVYFGVLDGETVSPRYASTIESLVTQDRWRAIWKNTPKGGVNSPRAQSALALSAKLANGTEVNRMPFTVSEGNNPMDYRGIDENLKTALGGAKFVTVTGWPDADGVVGRPGDRHPQAFCVYWSMETVPASPSRLEPSLSPANQWVLAGIVNDVFRTLKMAVPEVTEVRPLTKSKAREHIWQVSLRLYGDVTTAQVRKYGPRISEMLAVPWVRVTDAEDGCVLYMGAKPVDDDFAKESTRALVASLDWEQAFLLTSVLGSNGAVPTLVSTDHLPSNEMVQVLDFSLPPGLDKMAVRVALNKLRAATGNAYIEVLDSLAGPTHLTIQTSVENPLPSLVPYDFAKADEVDEWNFATGVNGEPIDYDPKISPHLLIVGGTGGGKSVLAQAILYGVALNKSELYIIDPVKGAADFKFLEPFCKAIGTTVNDAALIMKHVYSIVSDRVKVNAKYGAGSYRDLPEDIRPPHIVVMVDEFVSLIETSKVEKQPFDDPEMEQDRLFQIKDNNDRIAIGTYVGKIAREARSAGVTVILATQKLTADNLASIPSGSTLKTNLARILLGNTNQWDRMAALRQPDAAPELGSPIPKGRGLWESVETMPVVMQVWYATAAQYAEEISKRLTPLGDDERLDLGSLAKTSKVAPSAFSPLTPDDEPDDEPDEVTDIGEFTFSLDSEGEAESDTGDTEGDSGDTRDIRDDTEGEAESDTGDTEGDSGDTREDDPTVGGDAVESQTDDDADRWAVFSDHQAESPKDDDDFGGWVTVTPTPWEDE
jgi:hypothetical protein